MGLKITFITFWISALFIFTLSFPHERQERERRSSSNRPCVCRGSDMDCSSKNLNIITDDDVKSCPRASNVDLSDNEITDFSKISGIGRLKVLNVARNNISDIKAVVQYIQGSMEEFVMTGNVIAYIQADDFSDLRFKKLIGLEVQEFRGDGPFQHLKKLDELELTLHSESVKDTIFEGIQVVNLELTLTKAKSLPNKLFGHLSSHVMSIRLTGVHLEAINYQFSLSTKLRKVFLDLPNFTALPEDLLCAKSIQTAENLNISSHLKGPLVRMTDTMSPHCLFTEVDIRNVYKIPESFFKRITTLENVRLRNVTEMPNDMFYQISTLKELDLSHNSLTEIPYGWFDPLKSVTKFNMSHNKLSYLNESTFRNIRNIEILDLSSNQLHTIDAKTFQPFHTSVKMINLSHNNLDELPSGLFSGMLSLEHLLLINASIRHIPNDTFYQMGKLETLEAQHNQLQSVKDNYFFHLDSLKRLDLSYNQIERIGDTAFRHMTVLEVVNLEGNNLFSLRPILFNNTILSNLNIKNNKIHCDCTVYRFYEYYDLTFDAVCATPDDLKGNNISDLSDDICMTTTQDQLETTQMLQKTVITTTQTLTTMALLTDDIPIDITTDENNLLVTDADNPLIDITTQSITTNKEENILLDISTESTTAVHEENILVDITAESTTAVHGENTLVDSSTESTTADHEENILVDISTDSTTAVHEENILGDISTESTTAVHGENILVDITAESTTAVHEENILVDISTDSTTAVHEENILGDISIESTTAVHGENILVDITAESTTAIDAENFVDESNGKTTPNSVTGSRRVSITTSINKEASIWVDEIGSTTTEGDPSVEKSEGLSTMESDNRTTMMFIAFTPTNQNVTKTDHPLDINGKYSTEEQYTQGIVTLGDNPQKNADSNDVSESTTTSYDFTNMTEAVNITIEGTYGTQMGDNSSWIVVLLSSVTGKMVKTTDKDGLKYDDYIQAVQMDEGQHNRLRVFLWIIATILIILNVILLVFFIKKLEGWLYKKSYVVNKSVHLY